MAGKCVLLSFLWIAIAIVLSARLATSAEESNATTPTITSAAAPPTGPSTAAPPTGPSTAAPPTGPSSAAPTTGPSTAAPPTGPSTAAPPTGPSSAAPTTGPSTAAPPTGPSTAAPPTGPSSAAPTTGPSTAAPTTGPSTAAPTTGPSTAAPTPPNPCDQNLCGQGSTCQPRANQSFVCVCLPGDNYNNATKSCESAKVFPGQLGLPSIPYNEAMKNTESQEFQAASNQITDALDVTFQKSNGYSGSSVLELQPYEGIRSEPGVRASVEMFFRANSEITTQDVNNTLNIARNSTDGVLVNSVFQETNLCLRKPCDTETAKCQSTDGTFTCTCDPNYIPTSFSDRMCVACPSGTKAVESECKECTFGYSGLNCSENWKLILVIVGSVLGGLLLIALILLPVVAKRSTKKSGKKFRSEDLGKPYMSHSPAKAPLANNGYPVSVSGSGNGVAGFASTGAPKIPRATANSSWDSSTNLEMTPSNSRQNLMGKSSRLNDDQDDFNPYSRSTSNLNFQIQPRSNPYAQNRPQSNPYPQSQGHTNPYYSQDEGRRY